MNTNNRYKRESYYKYLFTCFIVVFFIASCTCQKLEIKHLPFYDIHSNTYLITDRAKSNPFPNKTLYYSINQSSLNCINKNELDAVVKSDAEIQRQIKNKYHRVSVILYKMSDDVENAIKYQSREHRPIGYNDIVAEYIWDKRKLETTLHYEDGQILGSDEIILKN